MVFWSCNACKMLQYAATCLAFTKVSFRWIVFSEPNSHHNNYRRTLMRHKVWHEYIWLFITWLCKLSLKWCSNDELKCWGYYFVKIPPGSEFTLFGKSKNYFRSRPLYYLYGIYIFRLFSNMPSVVCTQIWENNHDKKIVMGGLQMLGLVNC